MTVTSSPRGAAPPCRRGCGSPGRRPGRCRWRRTDRRARARRPGRCRPARCSSGPRSRSGSRARPPAARGRWSARRPGPWSAGSRSPVPAASLLRSTNGTALRRRTCAGPWHLVEDLVRGHPHEVGVHELHDRPEPAVQRHAAAHPANAFSLIGVPRTRSGNFSSGRLGGTVGAALEPVDVLTQDDDRLVGLHAAGHDVADDVDELAFPELAAEGVQLLVAAAAELAQVTADADVDEARVRPLVGPDPALARACRRDRLQQRVADRPPSLRRTSSAPPRALSSVHSSRRSCCGAAAPAGRGPARSVSSSLSR